MGSDKTRRGRRLFEVIAVSLGPFGLVSRLDEAGAEAVGRNTEMKLPDEDGTAGDVLLPRPGFLPFRLGASPIHRVFDHRVFDLDNP